MFLSHISIPTNGMHSTAWHGMENCLTILFRLTPKKTTNALFYNIIFCIVSCDECVSVYNIELSYIKDSTRLLQSMNQ